MSADSFDSQYSLGQQTCGISVILIKGNNSSDSQPKGLGQKSDAKQITWTLNAKVLLCKLVLQQLTNSKVDADGVVRISMY